MIGFRYNFIFIFVVFGVFWGSWGGSGGGFWVSEGVLAGGILAVLGALGGHVGGMFAPRTVFVILVGPRTPQMEPCWAQVGGMLGPKWHFLMSFLCFLWYHPS